MAALTDIGNLLIQTFFSLYITVILLRLLLQLARAAFYNPISQFLVRATAPVLKPLRRVIPGFFGIDFSSIVLALVLQMLATSLLLAIAGYGMVNPLFLLIWAVLGCIGIIVNIYFVGIIVSIILSWVSPGSYNPAVILLHQLTEPVMAPFRQIIPPLGGLDLSPIFVFLVIKVVQIILSHGAAAVLLPPRFVIGI